MTAIPTCPEEFHIFDTSLRDGAQQEGLRLTVADRPGVLAAIAATLAQGGVSIETVRQKTGAARGLAELSIATHRAPESDVATVLDALRASDAVTEIRSVLRIEGE